MAYTISTPRLDDAFRRLSHGETVLQRVLARRWPERDESDTDTRWGVAGDFKDDDDRPYILNPRPPEDDDEPPPVPIYREVQKQLELVRIENPVDAEDWVETKRRIWSLMQHSETGALVLFEWNNSDIDD